jgi:hypothetical protein
LEIIAVVIHFHPISFRGYSIYTKDLEEELMYLKTFTQTNHVLYPALLKIFNLPSMSRPLSVQKRTRLRPCSVCATHSNSILYPPLLKTSIHSAYGSSRSVQKTQATKPMIGLRHSQTMFHLPHVQIKLANILWLSPCSVQNCRRRSR